MKKPMKKPMRKFADGGAVSSDPQSKRKRTWGEWAFGSTEGNAIASAEYKRGMGINPKAGAISNAEASRSARSMSNPTSAPYKPGSSASKPKDQSRLPNDPVAPTPKSTAPKASAPKAAAPKLKAAPPKPMARPASPPKPTAKPAPSRSGGLGVTTGKTTGTSASRSGTGGLSKMTPYERMMRNAREK